MIRPAMCSSRSRRGLYLFPLYSRQQLALRGKPPHGLTRQCRWNQVPTRYLGSLTVVEEREFPWLSRIPDTDNVGWIERPRHVLEDAHVAAQTNLQRATTWLQFHFDK